MGSTLAEKVWHAHVGRRPAGEPALLYIDLHLSLLNGLDDISLTLQHAEAITAYERRRREALPTTRRTGRCRAVAAAAAVAGPPQDSRSTSPSLKESHP